MTAFTHQQLTSHAGRELSRISLSHLRDAKEVIVALDVEDKESFAAVIRHMLSFDYTQAELADKFHVSEATISRWASDKSLPAKLARGAIIARLVEMLDARIREHEQELQQVACA